MRNMSSLLGESKRGLVFIVSAPAGTGKTTLVNKLVAEFDSVIASVSFTTRKPRPGEKEGVHYHFISSEKFQLKIASFDFLEYVNLYGTYYGTSKEWIEKKLAHGKHVVLVIDTQGALQLKDKFPAIFIFIHPPSLRVLEERLRMRGSENENEIEKRLVWAQSELEMANRYDYQLINDDLNNAYRILSSIFIAETHRIRGTDG